MFTDTKCEFKIDNEFGDFRDWFIIEKKPVHKTLMQVFMKNKLMGDTMIPINAKLIKCKIETKVTKGGYLKYMEVKVPEMNIYRKTKFKSPQNVHIGDKLNATINFELNKE